MKCIVVFVCGLLLFNNIFYAMEHRFCLLPEQVTHLLEEDRDAKQKTHEREICGLCKNAVGGDDDTEVWPSNLGKKAHKTCFNNVSSYFQPMLALITAYFPPEKQLKYQTLFNNGVLAACDNYDVASIRIYAQEYGENALKKLGLHGAVDMGVECCTLRDRKINKLNLARFDRNRCMEKITSLEKKTSNLSNFLDALLELHRSVAKEIDRENLQK